MKNPNKIILGMAIASTSITIVALIISSTARVYKQLYYESRRLNAQLLDTIRNNGDEPWKR